MTTLRVLLHVAAQRDYELHSLDFSTAFLQGSLHEEIWLRRPPGFTGSFLAGTQWSLQRPVYGLRQAPCEWHDTHRTTLAALGFAPPTAVPSQFLRTDATLPLFYVLVYVDDLVFATADTEALAHVKSELQKRPTCTDLGELTSYLGLRITRDRAQRTITLTQSHMVQQVLQRFGFTYSSPQSTPLPPGHSLSAPPSDESVEPSGPYPQLVGCLICEAEIYAGAMAAQELRWLTYLLTDLGEAPRSPPVLLCGDFVIHPELALPFLTGYNTCVFNLYPSQFLVHTFFRLFFHITERGEPASCPASPVRTGCCVPRLCPPPVLGTHAMALRPSYVPLRVPLPPPPESSLLAVPDPESDSARAATHTVFCLLATVVTDPSFESTAASALVAELVDIAAACRLDYATALVSESASAFPPSVEGECAFSMDVLEDKKEDFECLAAAVPHFASMLLSPEGDPDASHIPTPRS
ncbi:unnamed protein product [Closterium sp. NIES-54]